jgi:flagellar biosynthesis anti-sigma factor FlgM
LSGLPDENVPNGVSQIRQEILKSWTPGPIPNDTKAGGPHVAVNLKGIDLAGATMGFAHKTAAASPAATGSLPQTATTSSQEAASQPAEVNITSTASLLASLERSLGAMPAIDQSRVDSLSQAINAGTYQVRPEQIVSGMLQSDHELRHLNLSEI